MNATKFCACLAILAIGFAGCKKNDDSAQTGYYLRFKVNGILKEYSGEVPNNFIVYSPGSGAATYQCVLTGVRSTADAQVSPPKNWLSIILYSEEPFVTDKTYQLQEPFHVNTIPIASMVFIYHDENGKSYVANILQTTPLSPTLRDAATIRFDELNTTSSKGIFTGVATNVDDKTFVTVTEGEFYLKAIQNGGLQQ